MQNERDLNREVAEKVMGWSTDVDDVGYWADDYGMQYWTNSDDIDQEDCVRCDPPQEPKPML
jgi:hypothetical protein